MPQNQRNPGTPDANPIQTSKNTLHLHDGNLEESRAFTTKDIEKLTTWRTTYRTLEHQFHAEHPLLTLGKTLYHWLNGDAGWLDRITANPSSPWHVEFTTPAQPNEQEALFLDAPWELLANDQGFLAAQEALQYNPIRRLG